MERLRRLPRERHTNLGGPAAPTEVEPSPRPEPVATDPAQAASVEVISGASVHTFPLAGLQVAHARTVLAPILRLDPRAAVLVNGEPIRPSRRLEAGDRLEFVHHAGEKGSHGWTSDWRSSAIRS